MQSTLEFGWFLPTAGDSSAFGVPEASIPVDAEHMQRVVDAAESAGFEYLLIPVAGACWDAYMTGAFIAATSKTIAPLIAARPGYINPVLLAKMIATVTWLVDRETDAEGGLIVGSSSFDIVGDTSALSEEFFQEPFVVEHGGNCNLGKLIKEVLADSG